MTNKNTLIKQLFEYFNGNMSDDLFRDITHEDYHFMTNLGSNFPRDVAMKNLQTMRFFVSTEINNIVKISENEFEIDSNIEVVDLEINFYKNLPTITYISFKEDKIVKSDIHYETSPEVLAVLKTIRAKSLMHHVDTDKPISSNGLG